MTTEKMLFALIQYEICGTPLPKGDLSCDWEKLMALAKRHDMAHLVGSALEKNGLLPEDGTLQQQCRQKKLSAIYREVKQNEMLERIRRIFGEEKIAFLPLKGAYLRLMYPEPWMRTSCDIDVLVHEADLDRATAALKQNGFTTDEIRDRHDVSFFYNGMHMELHFHICGNREKQDRILAQVWDHSVPLAEFEYAETPTFFAFHHIAHMGHHFMLGGCGIKPVVDFWILRNRNYYDEEELLPLLEEGGLVPFYRLVCRLTNVWMENAPYDEETRLMADFILAGGAYGNYETSAAIGTVRKRGKLPYLWSVAFPSYFYMCTQYPVLRKHRLLLPVFYVYRVFAKLFGKDRARVRSRWNSTKNQNAKKAEAIRRLIHSTGLDA